MTHHVEVDLDLLANDPEGLLSCAKALQNDIIEANSKIVASLVACNNLNGTKLHLVDNVDRLVEELDKSKDKNRKYVNVLFMIGELIMPVGSYSEVRERPELIFNAVHEMYQRFLSMLNTLPANSSKIEAPALGCKET